MKTTLVVLTAFSLAAFAAPTGHVVEIDGEPHLVLNMEAQQRIGQAFTAKDAEITALRAQFVDKHKADCNLI